MKQLCLLCITLLLFVSCESCHVFQKAKGVSVEELRSSQAVMIEQEGTIYRLDELVNNIELARKPFDIYFTMPPMNRSKKKNYTCQIAALKTEQEMNQAVVGKYHKDIPYYSPGTGMATLGPYETMYFGGGHHYIFYEMMGHQRAELVQELDNDLLRLKWRVEQFKADGNMYDFDHLPFDTFYVVVMHDQNLNKMVNVGEVTKIEVKLQ